MLDHFSFSFSRVAVWSLGDETILGVTAKKDVFKFQILTKKQQK
jgi:hypothetical protein